jgi:hypothetical protein
MSNTWEFYSLKFEIKKAAMINQIFNSIAILKTMIIRKNQDFLRRRSIIKLLVLQVQHKQHCNPSVCAPQGPTVKW